MMKTSMVLFAEFVNRPQQRAPHSIQEVFGSQNRSRIGRKLPRERNSLHTQASQALLVVSKQGSVVQQLQRIGMQEREKNRAAMKSLVRCTHFLTRHRIAHSTNFTQLVDLVLSCGARELQVFIENALKKCNIHFSRGNGCLYRTWNMGREVYFKRHQFLVSWQMSALVSRQWRNCQFSVIRRKMALLLNAFWTLPLKKADAESIYLALVKCIKDKKSQVGNIEGMGFDGAATFSGKDWCLSKTKETCSTCSTCPLSPPAISLRASCY